MEKIIAVYTRSPQKGNTDQIEFWVQACKVKANELNGDHEKIVVYNDEKASGPSKDKPALNALKEKISTGQVKVVIVPKLSTLSQSILGQNNLVLEFLKHGSDVICLDSNTHWGPKNIKLFEALANIVKQDFGKRISLGKRLANHKVKI